MCEEPLSTCQRLLHSLSVSFQGEAVFINSEDSIRYQYNQAASGDVQHRFTRDIFDYGNLDDRRWTFVIDGQLKAIEK